MTRHFPLWLRILGLVIAGVALILAVVNIILIATYKENNWIVWTVRGLCIACLLAGGIFNILMAVRMHKYKKKQEMNSKEVSREALNEEGDKVEE